MLNHCKGNILNMLKNYREIVKEVKGVVKEIDPSAEVYVFGSVVRGTYTAASDIDVLVIVKDISKKYKIMVEVYRRIDAPIELHVVTSTMFERWYKRFIPENELVKI